MRETGRTSREVGRERSGRGRGEGKSTHAQSEDTLAGGDGRRWLLADVHQALAGLQAGQGLTAGQRGQGATQAQHGGRVIFP
ncbi:hypothetical protein AALO_G00084410, partial [Alosa alosa]